jgi:TonB-dependent starch-binding outer membrane protein SusC
MAQRMWGVFVSLSLLGFSLASAQVRQVTGKVTNATTNAGIAEATLSIQGTEIVAQTGNDGNFALNAPDRPLTLNVRAIGYKGMRLTVPAEQGSVNVALEPDVFKLEELVITGQATFVEKRNLANAVATVDAGELTRAPTPTIESALQGKIPGATIQANSGAPGGGIQVNLRGVSTIIGDLEPLYVVDGMVVSDVAIPNGANAVTAAQVGGNPRNQDNPVNRIADLNPDDIERIEVLKGGSAAAIYGSKATNGVIFITTKHGQLGKPQFNVTQRFGFFTRANELGSRTFNTLDEALSVFSDTALVTSLYQQGRTFDNEKELFGHKPFSYETDASVSGGTERTKYYVSGLIKSDGGIATNTGYKKQSLRSNLEQDLGHGLDLQVNVGGIHSLSKRGLSNNDNSGTSPFLVFPFTPSFVNLLPTQSGDSLLPADFPDNPFQPSNPLQTFQFLRNDEDVWRILGTGTLRWSALQSTHHNLQFIGIGGTDYFQQDNNFVSPPELQFEPNDGQPGTVVLSKSSNRNLSLALNANHTYTPSDTNTQWTTSAGVQYEERRLFATQILGRTLISGEESPQQTANQTVLSRLEPVRDLGIFGQEELLFLNRRLLLTAGVRADRSSANGNHDKFFFYPKFAGSYRLVKPFGGMDEIKFRAAYGQTGNRAAFGALFSPDTTASIGGNIGTYIGTRSGDPTLKPERQKEIEGGFDATMADGRAQLSLTLYQKNINDLLLERTLAPSLVGQENQIFSSGSSLRDRGLEATLTVQPVLTKDINWVLRTTFFANRSKITRLTVPPFQTGGFSLSLGVFQIEQDSSPTQIYGGVGKDANGNLIAGKVGDVNPDFQMSFSSDVDIHRFTLGMLWDYKQGGDIINLTEFLYDAAQNTKDFLEAGVARNAQTAQGLTAPYIQSGTYVKLREVNLSYNLPDRFVSGIFGRGIRRARLSVTGRNLLRFTPYRGLDPEVSNFGRQSIVRNIDVAPFPPSRSFFFSIDLGF